MAINFPQGQPQSFQELRQMQEQKQAQLESKRQDLRLANMLARALDPGVPKGFRQLGLRQIAQTIGIDPKGDRAKEMIGAFSSLDPQSLEGIRDGIAEDISQLEPGQLVEMTKGILSGSTPPEELLQMVQTASQPPAPSSPLGQQEAPQEQPFPEPSMKLGGPVVPEDQKQIYAAQAQGAPPKYKAAQEALPPGGREAPGELPAVLGLEPERYSMSDIRKAGWDRIPDDPDAAKKVIDDVTTMQAGVMNSTSMINQVASLIRGRPEALDLSFKLPWGGGDVSFNPAATAESLKQFFQGMDNIQKKDVQDQTDFSDPKLMDAAKAAGNAITMPESVGREEAAQIRSRINSLMVPLAYAIARARHGTGVLSNQDVMAQLDSLGRSQSPDVFLAALKSTSNQLYSQYNQTTKIMTGKEVPISHLATDDFMQTIQAGGLAPKGMFPEGQPSVGGGPTRVSVTPEKQRIERKGGEAIEEMERLQTEAVKREASWKEEQKGLVRESAAREEERLEMARRAEAARRAERIQASFVELGRALRGGGMPQVPGAASLPGQQAGAFQVGQIRRREAPTIPQSRRATRGS